MTLKKLKPLAIGIDFSPFFWSFALMEPFEFEGELYTSGMAGIFLGPFTLTVRWAAVDEGLT